MDELTIRFLGDNITLRRYQRADLADKLAADEPDRQRIIERLSRGDAP